MSLSKWPSIREKNKLLKGNDWLKNMNRKKECWQKYSLWIYLEKTSKPSIEKALQLISAGQTNRPWSWRKDWRRSKRNCLRMSKPTVSSQTKFMGTNAKSPISKKRTKSSTLSSTCSRLATQRGIRRWWKPGARSSSWRTNTRNAWEKRRTLASTCSSWKESSSTWGAERNYSPKRCRSTRLWTGWASKICREWFRRTMTSTRQWRPSCRNGTRSKISAASDFLDSFLSIKNYKTNYPDSLWFAVTMTFESKLLFFSSKWIRLYHFVYLCDNEHNKI